MKRGYVIAALAAWLGLLALHLAWHGVPWPADARGMTGLALGVVPLLLPLLAWRRGLRHALLWLCLIGLGYFCHGVVELVVHGMAPFAAAEVALVVVLVAVLTVQMAQEKRARHHASLAGPRASG